MSYKIFALTTRGLEHVSADEMDAVSGCAVDTMGYRRVSATCAEIAPALGLRTVDDVFLHLAEWQIDHTRAMLAQMAHWSARLSLREAAEVCAEIRPLKEPLRFAITASFVGKRNYSTPEIKQACAKGITNSRHWIYVEDEREADLNIRIFIEHTQAFVGVRLAARPLHERAYKQMHLPGSLKPPIAAAMLRLADVQPGMRVLDPTCGAGTILIEGALMGAPSSGGDIDASAVSAAQGNAQAAGVTLDMQIWDAQHLPLADQSVDRVVCNLPWGRQVVVDDVLAEFYRRVSAEIERVLVENGQAVLLTGTPELVQFTHLQLAEQIAISVFGQTPQMMIFSAKL